MLRYFTAIRRRKRLCWALAGAIAFALAGGAFLYWYGRGTLDEFVDRDFRTLDEEPKTALAKAARRFLPEEFSNPRARLNKVLRRILPDEFNPDDLFARSFLLLEPWYLWRVKTGDGSGFILFQGHPLVVIPGNSGAVVHFLDGNGNHQAHSEFSTGWRIDMTDAALAQNDLIGAQVIEVHTAPSINGADIRRQIYGIFEHRVALLRIEDSRGKAQPNWYIHPNHQLGPKAPARTEEEWESLVLSSQPADVLEALVWIGGKHRSESERPERDVHSEETENTQLVAAVRRRRAVQKQIAELVESENQWLREAAVLAQSEMKTRE